MDYTVTVGVLFSELLVAASVVGSAYVVRDRLDRLGAAFEKHSEEDDRRFEAALAAVHAVGWAFARFDVSRPAAE